MKTANRTGGRASNPANVITVGASGCDYTDITSAAAAVPGILGPSAQIMVASADPVAGDYITITLGNHATLSDSVHRYEFAPDGTHDASVPLLGGGKDHIVDMSEDDWLTALAAPLSAAQGTLINSTWWPQLAPALTSGYNTISVVASADCPVEGVTKSLYRPPDEDSYEIALYPGTYDEAPILASGIHLFGVGPREAIVVEHDTGDGIDYAAVLTLGGQNCSVSNITINNTQATTGASVCVGYSMGEATTEVDVIDCLMTGGKWGISGGLGTVSQCRVRGCKFGVSQPFFVLCATQRCWYTANVGYFKGSNGNCLGPMDMYAVDCYGLIFEDNLFYLERTAVQSAGVQYMIRLAGQGHRLTGNVFEVAAMPVNTDDIAFIRALLGTTLPSGEIAQPTIIANNIFRLNILGVNQPANVYAVKVAVASGTAGDIVLRDNKFITDASGTKQAVGLSNQAGSSKVILEPNGINGMEMGAIAAATNGQVIGAPFGTGAGLTAALLDTAFCGTGNRSYLAHWFRGVYTNSADGNKRYQVWTDGTTWYYESVATAAS